MSDSQTQDAQFTEHKNTSLAINRTGALMSSGDIKLQINQIQELMRDAMQEGQHFGTIPGCGDKPTLLLPGAEKLALMFGFATEYVITQTDIAGGHREYNVRCKIHHRATGQFVGEGVGVCSTMEGKYRFRVAPKKLTNRPVPSDYWDARRSDPKKAQEILGGPAYGTKKDENGQWMITEGGNVKVEHDNPADYYNTIIKMATKRAYIHAIKTATASSDIFTQDIEDMYPDVVPVQVPEPPKSTTSLPQPPNNSPQSDVRPQGDGHAVVTVSDVLDAKEKIGKNGKPYTLWKLLDDRGNEYKSFDTDMLKTAENLIGRTAEIRWTVSQFKGNDQYNLTEISAGPTREPGADDDSQPGDQPDQNMPMNQTMKQVQFLSCEQSEKNGVKLSVWRVETNKGRFGVVDPSLAAMLLSDASNGRLYDVTYKIEKRGNLIIDYVDNVDDAPW